MRMVVLTTFLLLGNLAPAFAGDTATSNLAQVPLPNSPQAKTEISNLLHAVKRGGHLGIPMYVERVKRTKGAERAIPLLTAALREGKYPEAAFALGMFGPAAKSAVPALAEALGDRTWQGAGTYAFMSLEAIGPEAAPGLTQFLKGKGQSGRYSAAIVLVDIGPEGKAAIPVLMEMLKDRDFDNRVRAADALGKLGSKAEVAVPALIEALKGKSNPKALKDDNFRASAAAALGQIKGTAPGVIPALIEALKDHNVQWPAAYALGEIGPNARAAVPALTALLKKKNSRRRISFDHARVSAAEALWKIEGKTKPILPFLINALKDNRNRKGPWYPICYPAAEVLGAIGPRAKRAVPELRRQLIARAKESRSDVNADYLIKMAEALWKIEGRTKTVVPFLIKMLKHKHWSVRRDAAEVLGRIGPPARAAIPALTKALRDVDKASGIGNKDVRLSAAEALWRVGRRVEPVLPGLVRVLNKNAYPDVRVKAAAIVGRIGPEAREAVPALIKCLKDTRLYSEGYGYDFKKYQKMRAAPLLALAQIGPGAKAAIPAIKEALADKNPGTRVQAARAFWKVGGEAKFAVPVLTAELKDNSILVRRWAAEGLAEMGVQAKRSILALIKALKDEDEEVGSRVAFALGQMGREAKAAVPALLEALKSKEILIREAAANALKKIDRQAAAKAGIR
jgi:HEAT repeat protein